MATMASRPTVPAGPSTPSPTRTDRSGVSKNKSKLEEMPGHAKRKPPSIMSPKSPGEMTTAAKKGAGHGPVDLPKLKGLEVGDEGRIYGKDGKVLGRVVEGDPNDLVGQVVGGAGEIFDEHGRAVGRVEVLSKITQQQVNEPVSKTAPIDFDALQGLEVSEGGKIKSSTGEVIAKVVEGRPDDLVGFALNEQGEVIDGDGEAIGRVEILPQAGRKDDGNIKESGTEKQVKVNAEQATESVADVSANDAGPETKSPGAPDLSKLAGLIVNKNGEVADGAGNVHGKLEEGRLEDIVGKTVNERGLVLDNDGNIIGKAAVVEETVDKREDEGSNIPPLSTLEGLRCNKQGTIVDRDGNPVGKLVEGNARAIWKYGAQIDAQGQFSDNRGRVIGKAKTIEQKEGGEDVPFAGFESLFVSKDGWVEDENGNKIGQIVQGDSKKLLGRAVDPDGDILDKRGNVVGHAEKYEEKPGPEKEELSILKGLSPNKHGNIMGPDGIPIGRVIEGNPEQLVGKKVDENGCIWNDSGQHIGQCELIPEEERDIKAECPFAGIDVLVVVNDGLVEDENGNVVGKVSEGDVKKLRGRAVDEDGDIIDKHGNVKGHVEPYGALEEEVVGEDLSLLAGKAINKAGKIVDESGVTIGHVVSGDPKKLSGRTVDDKGQIWGDRGEVIGKAELMPEAKGNKADGPFSGFQSLTVGKDNVVLDSSCQVVGRVVEGDMENLMGRPVDKDGGITDKAGHTLGKAERLEPKEKKLEINPMSGRKVNKEGEVCDADGNLIGKLTAGKLNNLAGRSIDDSGYVVDNDGNKIGECTLLEHIHEEIEEPEMSPEQLEAEKHAEQERGLAKEMCSIVQQTLGKVGAVCEMIKEVSLSRSQGSTGLNISLR